MTRCLTIPRSGVGLKRDPSVGPETVEGAIRRRTRETLEAVLEQDCTRPSVPGCAFVSAIGSGVSAWHASPPGLKASCGRKMVDVPRAVEWRREALPCYQRCTAFADDFRTWQQRALAVGQSRCPLLDGL
jgi:hypothetical protein